MTEEWHYAHDGKQFGPVPSEELRRLASSGQLQPSDLIWKNGMATWALANKLKGLFPQAMSTKPGPPPVRQAIVQNPAPPPPEQLTAQNLASSPNRAGATPEVLQSSMSERIKDKERSGTSNAIPTQTADAMSGMPEVTTQEFQGESSPKIGEAIGGGILGGLLVSLCLSLCQRLVYGDWMRLWPLLTSSFLIGGALAVIGRQKSPSENDKQLQLGLLLGMGFGVLYGLYFGGSASHAFYGSCIGLTVAGLANWLHVAFTVGRSAGAVAMSFVVLHYLGFIGTTLSPNGSKAIPSNSSPPTSTYEVKPRPEVVSHGADNGLYVTVSTGSRKSREQMETLFETLVYKVKPGMTIGSVVSLLGQPTERERLNNEAWRKIMPGSADRDSENLQWSSAEDENSVITLGFENGVLKLGGTPGYDITEGFKTKLPANLTPGEKANLRRTMDAIGVSVEDN